MLNSNSMKAIIRDLIFISLYSRQVETNGDEYTTFLSIRNETSVLKFVLLIRQRHLQHIQPIISSQCCSIPNSMT